MVSDASKKKAAQKKAAAAAKRGSKSVSVSASPKPTENTNEVIEDVSALHISDRTCTAILASHPLSRDIHVRISFYDCGQKADV